MANGHGGARPGAGRKPKSAEERRLAGDAGHRGVVIRYPDAATVGDVPAADSQVVEPPPTLTPDELAVWKDLAPEATRNGTLKASTVKAFVMLCEQIVDYRAQRRLQAGSADAARTAKIVLGLLGDFDLRPRGKPVTSGENPQQQPLNPMWEKYIGGQQRA
jgi:hypothetical protein